MGDAVALVLEELTGELKATASVIADQSLVGHRLEEV